MTVTHTIILSLLQPPIVVAWSQSANKGYFCVIVACELHTLTADTRLHCSAHGLFARSQELLPADPLPISELTQSSHRLSLYSLWADPTENTSTCSHAVDVCDVV
jgi:hypothetical protein